MVLQGINLLDSNLKSLGILQATEIQPNVLYSFQLDEGIFHPVAMSRSEGDLILEAGQNISLVGKHQFNKVSIPKGSTLTLLGYALIRCQEFDFPADANIEVEQLDPGGRAFSVSGSRTPVLPGYQSGKGFGSPTGYGQQGKSYPADAGFPFGSGGQTGGINKATRGYLDMTTGQAGDGGGGLQLQVTKKMVLGGTITADGGSPAIEAHYANGDDKTIIGLISGSGGGSGGLIDLDCYGETIIERTFKALARGGKGGDPVMTPAAMAAGTLGAAPGSGGGGGIIRIAGVNLPTALPGTYDVSGGLSGEFKAGNYNTAVDSYFAGGTGGAFGSNTDNIFGELAQKRQNAGLLLINRY